MCEFDPDYDARIKKIIDEKFGGPSRPLSDPHILVGRWISQYPDGTVVIREFDATCVCRRWVRFDREGERHALIDKWVVRQEGWIGISREHKGVWYEDLWRVYVFDENRFVLANEDASIMLEHKRVARADATEQQE